MLPHKLFMNLAGRSPGAVAPFLGISKGMAQEEAVRMAHDESSEPPMSSTPRMRHDFTWNSTRAILFGNMNTKSCVPPNATRLDVGPSPSMCGRDEMRNLSTSARARAAGLPMESTADTPSQFEPIVGQKSTNTKAVGTGHSHTEYLHHDGLNSSGLVRGPSQDLGHGPIAKSLGKSNDTVTPNAMSRGRVVPVNTTFENEPSNLFGVLRGQSSESIPSPCQKMAFEANESEPSFTDHWKLSQDSSLSTEGKGSNKMGVINRQSSGACSPNAFAQTFQRNERKLAICERRPERIAKPGDSDRSAGGVDELSSSGRLNLHCSQPLTYPGCSIPNYVAGDLPLYPSLEGSQLPSGTEASGILESGQPALSFSPKSSPSSTEPASCTPLGFHIPKARLRQALDAPPTSSGAYWQYTLYQGPGGEKDKVKVHYCKSKDTTERISQLFLHEEVIGFDIEWKANATAKDGVKKNVALIQLASEQRIALFHIARYTNTSSVDDYVAPTFKKIMESPNITKVGVSVKGDCTRLRKFMNIESRGIFELSHLYKLVKFSCGDVTKINKSLVSLAQQVEEHLLLPLWKGDVRSSDWSQDLNYQQIQYAASDSYAGFQLFHILESKREALDPTPPRPAHAELDIPIQSADWQAVATYEAPENFNASDADSGPNMHISVEELAGDLLNLNIKEHSFKDASVKLTDKSTGRAGITSSSSLASPVPSSASATSSSASDPSSTTLTFNKPLHPDVVTANIWLVDYKKNRPAGRRFTARPAELRTYHLWYHQRMELHEIASRLREPPLAISTVASYILRSIQAEHLPFDRKNVLALFPNAPRSLRGIYKAMITQRLKEQDGSPVAQKGNLAGNEDTDGGSGDFSPEPEHKG